MKFAVNIIVFILVHLNFGLHSYNIQGGGMEPTLSYGEPASLFGRDNDVVIVEKISPFFRMPRRKEILAYKFSLPTNPPKVTVYAQRLIGFPNEEICLRDGKLFVDGTEIEENYILEPYSRDFKVKVPKGCVFFLGDNRNNCCDSKILGPISIEQIEGLVLSIYWPIERAKWFYLEDFFNIL